MDIEFTAAILAGGRGRRMGGADKSALLVGSAAILDRQLALLRRLTPHILIVDSDGTRVRRADVPVVVDCIEGAGALGGVYTALALAPTEQVLVIACDMPFLDAPFLTHLAARGAGVEAVVPRDAGGRHPLCASYQRRVAGRLQARIERGQLRVLDALADLEVVEIGPAELVAFYPRGILLRNINTPQDYDEALAALAGSAVSASGTQRTKE